MIFFKVIIRLETTTKENGLMKYNINIKLHLKKNIIKHNITEREREKETKTTMIKNWEFSFKLSHQQKKHNNNI